MVDWSVPFPRSALRLTGTHWFLRTNSDHSRIDQRRVLLEEFLQCIVSTERVPTLWLSEEIQKGGGALGIQRQSFGPSLWHRRTASVCRTEATVVATIGQSFRVVTTGMPRWRGKYRAGEHHRYDKNYLSLHPCFPFFLAFIFEIVYY